jgi:NAD(P)-dependent dehydrogenase (short-subunit alcohol dehydrogenase family)
MTKIIVVCGATGNQGGSVAKLLLKHPEQYSVRALTRDPTSGAATELAQLGATVVQVDLTVPSSLKSALDGCWGVFGVTNFYDAVCSTSTKKSSQSQEDINLSCRKSRMTLVVRKRKGKT